MPLDISHMTGKTRRFFKIVHCGSKGLTSIKQRYSTIELECLAIVWAIQKCSFYLRGLPLFRVYTDHWPLEGVFQKDIFDLANPCLQRWREKVAMFSFQTCWVPGKTSYRRHIITCPPFRSGRVAWPRDRHGYFLSLANFSPNY